MCYVWPGRFSLVNSTAAVLCRVQTNNPRKMDVLTQLGVKITGRIPCQVQAGKYNEVGVCWLGHVGRVLVRAIQLHEWQQLGWTVVAAHRQGPGLGGLH